MRIWNVCLCVITFAKIQFDFVSLAHDTNRQQYPKTRRTKRKKKTIMWTNWAGWSIEAIFFSLCKHHFEEMWQSYTCRFCKELIFCPTHCCNIKHLIGIFSPEKLSNIERAAVDCLNNVSKCVTLWFRKQHNCVVFLRAFYSRRENKVTTQIFLDAFLYDDDIEISFQFHGNHPLYKIEHF